MSSAIALKSSSTTLQSFTYTDAPSGDILAETDTPTSSQSPAVYSYDAKDRVTSMTLGSGATVNYSFDASSNLTTFPTGDTATYDKAEELTSSSLSGTTTTYTYNADGERSGANQGSTTVASGAWNGALQLRSYSNSAANMNGAVYNGDGLRTSSTVTLPGGSATTQAYVWSTVGAIPQMIMDSSNAYIYTFGQAPTEQVSLSNGVVSYLVADLLGSVRGTVSGAGTLTASTSYDAWGNPNTPGGLTSRTAFGFAGSYTDATGLIYLVNRYYDPATAQFLSVDPEVAQTAQAYAYANANPVNEADPVGLSVCTLSIDDAHESRYWKDRGVLKMSVDAFVKCTRKVYFIYMDVTLWKRGCWFFGISWCSHLQKFKDKFVTDTSSAAIRHTERECTNRKRTTWFGIAEALWGYRWGIGYSSKRSPHNSGSSTPPTWYCGT